MAVNNKVPLVKNKVPLVRKSSGELEPFSPEKLKRSLQNSGAAGAVIDEIVKDAQSWIYDGIPSKSILDRAFAQLRRHKRTLDSASRYKLKKAIVELGPTGHPFEHFIGQVLKAEGFDVEVAQVLEGHCVTHEIDVIATKGKEQYFFECKFHHDPAKNANVQVPLYVRSRVDDIIRMRKDKPGFADYTFFGGVVTNTRFTPDASAYGNCVNLKLLSWDYPVGNSLKDIIDRHKIYPITSLTHLTLQCKQKLLDRGIVICHQIKANPNLLDDLCLDQRKKEQILNEIRVLVG